MFLGGHSGPRCQHAAEKAIGLTFLCQHSPDWTLQTRDIPPFPLPGLIPTVLAGAPRRHHLPQGLAAKVAEVLTAAPADETKLTRPLCSPIELVAGARACHTETETPRPIDRKRQCERESSCSLDSSSSLGQAAQIASQAAEQGKEVRSVSGRRKRGRPSGMSCWNKGVRMPHVTKSKISRAQKARWQDPKLNLRLLQSQKQKGKEPWNKGKTASSETRQKMSSAKRYAVYSKSTTDKMSRSHTGLVHSPETCALISKQLSGRLKTSEHRAAIAAGQRRRISAVGMLKAVQGVVPRQDCASEQEMVPFEEDAAEPGGLAGSENILYTNGASSQPRPKKKSTCHPSQNDAVIEEFVGQLRQFRALQQELAPWTEAFRAKHCRKPRMEDVELTGIDWLVAKFKEYMRMRDCLLCESQQLRTKLEQGAVPDAGIGSYREKMNANATTAAMSEGAMRMAKALQYRRSRSGELPAPGLFSSPAGQSAKRQMTNGLSEITAALAASSLADQEVSCEQQGAQQGLCRGAGSGQAGALTKQEDKSQQEAPKQTPVLEDFRNPANLAGASPRVKAAMLAAAQYRKKKETHHTRAAGT